MNKRWVGILGSAVLFGSTVTAMAQGPGAEEAAGGGLPALSIPKDVDAAVSTQLTSVDELARNALDDPEATNSDRAEAVGELGRHYHAYGLTEAALPCYVLAAELAPRDFRWPYLRGYLVQGEGRHQEAIDLYERALAIVPGVGPALIRLAESYSELGKPDKSEWLYREALRSDPESSAAAAGLGELLLSKDRPEEAVKLLEKALDRVPDANRLFYPLALAYRKLGKEDKARELLAWRGNVGVKPADPVIDSLETLRTGERVYLLQGQSAFRVGRYVEAAERFRKALEINPSSVAGWIDLGSALGQMADADGAIEAYERAIELAPGNETALFNLGVLLSRGGNYEQAIDYLSQAGQFAPTDGEIRYELAQALRLMGRFDDAILHFDASIETLPALEAPRLGKAQAQVRAGDVAGARATLEAGLEQIPGSVGLAMALSRILAMADDPALRDGEKAVQLAYRIFEARKGLSDAEWVSETLARADRCEEAATWQRMVLEQADEAGQSDEVRARLQARLEGFERGAPCSGSDGSS